MDGLPGLDSSTCGLLVLDVLVVVDFHQRLHHANDSAPAGHRFYFLLRIYFTFLDGNVLIQLGVEDDGSLLASIFVSRTFAALDDDGRSYSLFCSTVTSLELKVH